MQNRRQRRDAERQSGMMKLERIMTADEKSEFKKRKAEYVKQLMLHRAQEAENKRINDEANQWSSSIESMMKDGISREKAEEILQGNRDRIKEREEKLAARRERQKAKLAASRG